jgi:hypothetical protein
MAALRGQLAFHEPWAKTREDAQAATAAAINTSFMVIGE